jgi:hypothetical protein
MLSGGAIRELLWMMLNAAGIDPSPHVSELRDRRDRYRATRELEEAGLIQVTRVRGKGNTLKLRFRNISNSNYISYISGSELEATSGANTPQGCGVNTPPVGDTPYEVNTPLVGETPYGYDSLEDEADDIDSMPDEGRDTPAKAHTPFRTRRKKQREFVQRIWGEIYPNLPPLIDANANEFLKLCDESAYEVLTLFQKFQGSSKACFAYLRAVARNQQAKQRAEAQPQETISPASTGSVSFPGWESDEAYYAHLEKVKQLQQWMSENGISDDD